MTKLEERGLTVAEIRELFTLDIDTGDLYWRVAGGPRVIIGGMVGSIHPSGYVKIRLRGIDHMAHRVVFAHANGHWPSDFVDHINRVKCDNRPVNLREADHSLNMQNMDFAGKATAKNNTTGTRGVHYCNTKNRYIAKICGKRIGAFETLDLAVGARQAAEGALWNPK